LSETKLAPAPWRFDGHGINDSEGQRICKVSCCEPYIYDTGQPQRNAEFDRLSNLIAAVNEMREALEAALYGMDEIIRSYTYTHVVRGQCKGQRPVNADDMSALVKPMTNINRHAAKSKQPYARRTRGDRERRKPLLLTGKTGTGTGRNTAGDRTHLFNLQFGLHL
jgi:hypothetical protein